MGDWMTVQVVGMCDASEVAALRSAASYDWETGKGFYGPLAIGGGICALGEWPSKSMSITGNCAERGFTPASVAEHLELLAKAAPSLEVKVHCGEPYESSTVAKTVTLRGGKAVVGDPEIERLPDIDQDAMAGRLLKQLMKPR